MSLLHGHDAISDTKIASHRPSSHFSERKISSDTTSRYRADTSIIHKATSKLDDYKNIYGRCGIITACLVDPLSQLINKFSGLREDDMNAVGFYYEAEFHGINKMTVILFNTYDNDPIPWLRLGYTMDLLLGSPFVTKIAFYPLVNSGPLLTRASIKSKTVKTKLEETFRAIVIQTININANAIHDKNLSYTALLLRIAGITGEEVDRLIGSIMTGYSLVNKVLLTLMGIEKADLVKISSSIIPCPLLQQPITITAPYESGHESDIKYVIEESRREITKLVAVFVDLFTSHEMFRQNVLATRLSSEREKSDISKLLHCEEELITHMVDGIQNGVISNETLNELIKDLMNERFQLNNYQPLALSTRPLTEVKVIDETIMCTFQQPTSIQNTEPLQELGNYIQHLADCFENPQALTINLGTLISLYNDMIKGTSLNKVEFYPKNPGNHTMSRPAIITLPGQPNSETLTLPFSTDTIAIPMYNCNLTPFTDSQLLDVLVYIDSLRSSDGTHDTRFSTLQNEITHELAQRARMKRI
jgi:hypothetical protein